MDKGGNKDMFTKKEIFSIPNILCYFRILLVPVFLYTYFTAESTSGHVLSAAVLIISSFSDFLDGYIARKYDMITELGKLIDPVADKLTQFVVACTLMYTYPAFGWLVAIIVLKDGMLLFVGYFIYKKTGKHLEQAEMPGKIATAVFFVISILLVAFYIPGTFVADLMIYSTVGLMMLAMFYYGRGLYILYISNK
ncbi:MAG: CDP-alcohol phosphatidyltransferase family protein [Coprobacillus sp.]